MAATLLPHNYLMFKDVKHLRAVHQPITMKGKHHMILKQVTFPLSQFQILI